MDYRVVLFLSAVIAILIVLGGLLFQYLEGTTQAPTSFTVSLPISKPILFDENTTAFIGDLGRNYSALSEAVIQVLSNYDSFNNWETNLTAGYSHFSWLFTNSTSELFNISSNGSTMASPDDSDLVLQADLIMKPINPWTFYNSLFFAESLITTIGFGNIAPKTTAGRLCACLYAIIGIPVVGVWMSGIGEFILAIAKKIRNRVALGQERRRAAMIIQATAIFFLGCGVFVLFPSWLFSIMEDWSYVDGFYFAVMTLLVVGLGDLVAGTNDNVPGWYRVFINFWLLFGLGWESMIVSFVLEIIKSKASKVARQVQKVALFTEKLIAHRLEKNKIKHSQVEPVQIPSNEFYHISEEDETVRQSGETNVPEMLDVDAGSVKISFTHSPVISRSGSIILPVDVVFVHSASSGSSDEEASEIERHSGEKSGQSSRSGSFRSGNRFAMHLMSTIDENTSKTSTSSLKRSERGAKLEPPRHSLRMYLNKSADNLATPKETNKPSQSRDHRQVVFTTGQSLTIPSRLNEHGLAGSSLRPQRFHPDSHRISVEAPEGALMEPSALVTTSPTHPYPQRHRRPSKQHQLLAIHRKSHPIHPEMPRLTSRRHRTAAVLAQTSDMQGHLDNELVVMNDYGIAESLHLGDTLVLRQKNNSF